MGNIVTGLLIAASVVMAVLKLAGVIGWPWLPVLLPGLIGVGLVVIGVVAALVITAVAAYLATRK
jgi:O-antigen ligase